MTRLVSSLLAGPAWQPLRAPATIKRAASLPLLTLVAGACVVALLNLRPATAGWAPTILRGVLLAGAGTLLCLAASLPAAIARPGPVWLLPAWLAASVGAAGWSLIAVPDTPPIRSVQIAVLLLPFMVLGLDGARLGDLSRAAAAAGAGPLSTARLLTRAAWPASRRVLIASLALGTALALAFDPR